MHILSCEKALSKKALSEEVLAVCWPVLRCVSLHNACSRAKAQPKMGHATREKGCNSLEKLQNEML